MPTAATNTPPGRDRDDPEQWVDQYADSLYGFALLRVTNAAVAEELVQDTFLAALTAFKGGKFHGKSSLKSWLTGILKHKIMDHFRKKYRNSADSFEDIREEKIADFFDARGNWRVKPGRWGDTPQKKYEQQELMLALIECIDTLAERQADAFRLRELDGEEAKVICKVLQISATNYWVLMHRARLAMRRCMEPHWAQRS
ncbi:MAG TPA: sigma-70 family RNA polymerase sigma factor [Desulfopila sp.]|nr:sigma-70 family RNA polymerase sigma factor [Desulfopila sp.]